MWPKIKKARDSGIEILESEESTGLLDYTQSRVVVLETFDCDKMFKKEWQI